MQTVFNGHGVAPLALSELREGENGILETLDLPEEFAVRLMELGFIPGHPIAAGKTAPGGDPRIYRVDGSEIALRKETCSHILIRASA
ncbi:MAG: ferrous iron transport protein A [Bryobacterales bacterium]|nr:ferrous iron transport protein A [Bryobacterales bacterium]